jgi:hypothetical protein
MNLLHLREILYEDDGLKFKFVADFISSKKFDSNTVPFSAAQDRKVLTAVSFGAASVK